MSGYAGKILQINLASRTVSTIETSQYEQYGGGHGFGSAIFFDLVKDKAISGFDPRNTITIMNSPLSGTLAPAVAGRSEAQGIGVQAYPYEWFTRGNVGGRFSAMLKYASWDGVVIEGSADKPVWIDIRNEEVAIRDAQALWGKDAWDTQRTIWNVVAEEAGYGGWIALGEDPESGRTTQRPAVLAIGPVGESRSRMGALIHDAGSAVGQAGFGGIWGAKNLKALSVIGTGSASIADPQALVEARIWAKQNYGFMMGDTFRRYNTFPGLPGAAYRGPSPGQTRPSGCLGCHISCRRRSDLGGNDSSCYDYGWYQVFDQQAHGGQQTAVTSQAADLIQQAGINATELDIMVHWMRDLYKQGLLGSGKRIDTDLPFDKLGDMEFLQKLVAMIQDKTGIGTVLHQGLPRAAKEWGLYEEGLKTGHLPLQYWGYVQHYDARTEAEWGYGSLVGDRDINEHDFNVPCYWVPTSSIIMFKQQPPVTAEEFSQIIAEKCSPYNDPFMIDYSDEGIYSEHMAKTVAWHRHYTRFYKQSIGYCDWAWSDIINDRRPDKRGLTPVGEVRFINAVTGKNMSFEDGMEIGRRIWNIDRAIWILQGRDRKMEVFPPYTYDVGALPTESAGGLPVILPAYENGQWTYKNVTGRKLDRAKVEGWKTKYYKLEGWDPETGWPTRSTLEALDLGHVADELGKHKKLGRG